MNSERLRAQIEEAIDLLQMVTEDIEENFIGSRVDNGIKARATMTVSALNILSDYMRSIAKEAQS